MFEVKALFFVRTSVYSLFSETLGKVLYVYKILHLLESNGYTKIVSTLITVKRLNLKLQMKYILSQNDVTYLVFQGI